MDPVYLGLAVLVLYGILVLADCFIVARKLRSLVEDKKNGNGFPFCYTYPGKHLLKLSENIEKRKIM